MKAVKCGLVTSSKNWKSIFKMNTKITDTLTSSQYHAIKNNDKGEPYASKSSVWSCVKDAESYQAVPFKPTPATIMGSYLDAHLLDRQELVHFYDAEDNPHLSVDKNGNKRCASKEAKRWKAEMEESGKFAVTAAQTQQIKSALKKISENEDSRELLEKSKSQVALFTDNLHGMPFKGLLDIVPHSEGRYGDGLADLKRTSKWLPNEFKWHLMNMGYHVQAAAYLTMWNMYQEEHGGNDFRDKWYFLLSSSDAPYGAGVAELSQEKIDEGKEWLKNNIPKFKQIIYTNSFKNPYEQNDIIF